MRRCLRSFSVKLLGVSLFSFAYCADRCPGPLAYMDPTLASWQEQGWGSSRAAEQHEHHMHAPVPQPHCTHLVFSSSIQVWGVAGMPQAHCVLTDGQRDMQSSS